MCIRDSNEIVLLNSHDGTSSYQMLAGMFRFVCSNGLVCGDTVADVHAQPYGEAVDAVTLIPHMLEAFMAGDRGFRKDTATRSAPSKPT